MIKSNFIVWLKLSILLFSIILILIGFTMGYVYNNYKNGSCSERPLSYGIEKFNEINNDSFTCACSAISGTTNPFYFNENGVYRGTFLDSQIEILP